MLAIYTVCHLLVDFASGWALYHSAASCPQVVLCVVLYNFMAFALQMPVGWWADIFNRNALVAASGCLLVGLAAILDAHPLLVASVAGLGNAFFHIGAGLDVLNGSPKRIAPLGIFVSSGALGIFYGCRLGLALPNIGPIIIAVLAIACAVIITAQRRRSGHMLSANAPYQRPQWTLSFSLATVCLFTVVIMRSYLGFAQSFPWKGTAYWGAALLGALVLGKMVGGIIADKWGMLRTCYVTLSAAALLFCFSEYLGAGIAAVWLFNMTMPLTLAALVAAAPGSKGWAFGMLTLGLFLGALPHLLGCDPFAPSPALYVTVTALSMVLLAVGLYHVKLTIEDRLIGRAEGNYRPK